MDAPGHLDTCFLMQGPISAVARHFEECGVEVAHGPFAQIGALGPMTSVYCCDPDGNLIEIASDEEDASGAT